MLKVTNMAKSMGKIPKKVSNPNEVDLTAIMDGMTNQNNNDDEENVADDSLDKTQEEEKDRTLFIWKGVDGRNKFPGEAFQECYATFLDVSADVQEEDDSIPLDALSYVKFYHNSKLGCGVYITSKTEFIPFLKEVFRRMAVTFKNPRTGLVSTATYRAWLHSDTAEWSQAR